jgi:hypothetical protein
MAQRKSAKASEFYSGRDSFGRGVELARRESDGQYFVRYQGYNGYGVGFGRWAKYNEPVSHPESVKNEYTGETVVFSTETRQSLVSWGFATLQASDTKGLRLPLE